MKIAIFIILYMVGVLSVGVYFYTKQKTKSFANEVDATKLFYIVLLSIFFPITYLLGVLMIIIEIIGDKLCKDQ